MIVLPDSKVVFMAVPRTASRAMRDALLKAYPDAITIEPHHCYTIPDEYLDFRVIHGVRNPYARYYSHWAKYYRNGQAKGASFKEWLKMDCHYPASDYTMGAAWYVRQKGVDTFAVKFEELPTSWNAACMIYFSQRLPLPLVQDGGHSLTAEWQSQYDRAAADLVWEKHTDDFIQYNYPRYGWRP